MLCVGLSKLLLPGLCCCVDLVAYVLFFVILGLSEMSEDQFIG